MFMNKSQNWNWVRSSYFYACFPSIKIRVFCDIYSKYCSLKVAKIHKVNIIFTSFLKAYLISSIISWIVISSEIKIHLTTLISNNNEWWDLCISDDYHHCQLVVVESSNFSTLIITIYYLYIGHWKKTMFINHPF